MKMSSASSDTQISDGGDLRALAVTTPPPFNGDIMRNGDVLFVIYGMPEEKTVAHDAERRKASIR